jgi:lipopolysaccharide export LptBFGC system permease protein LptF
MNWEMWIMIPIIVAIIVFFVLLYLGVKFEDRMPYQLEYADDWVLFILSLLAISMFWFTTIPLAIIVAVMYYISRVVIKLARKK